jgi:hypothetical protein
MRLTTLQFQLIFYFLFFIKAWGASVLKKQGCTPLFPMKVIPGYKLFKATGAFWFFPVVWGAVSYNLWESNRSLSRFYLLPQDAFFHSLRSRLLKEGRNERSASIFTGFLLFLKLTYDIDAIWFVQQAFLHSYTLPFRTYTIKLSNRNYHFPGPILSELEYQHLLMKLFSKALRKRNDGSFLDNFFSELCLFFDQQPDSILFQLLEAIVQQGMENRAFIHYRWKMKR